MFLAITLLSAGACTGRAKSERAILSADAEVFEAVVRAQISNTPDDSVVALRVLRVDSRPTSDNAQLMTPAQRNRSLDLDAPPDTLPPETLSRIAEQRKAILSDLHVEEGGPFNYPGCAGTRPHPASDSAQLPLDRTCPPTWHRYITVGLPFSGEAEVLARLRARASSPPDSTAESWTVLVTENAIGPAGQTWRQYACLLRRDAVTGQLALAEKLLLSWAE
jgi:hypothetical protein